MGYKAKMVCTPQFYLVVCYCNNCEKKKIIKKIKLLCLKALIIRTF